MKLLKDPKNLYLQLNERYFDGGLPLETEVKFVDYPGMGDAIDTTRNDAALGLKPDGTYVIELHSALKTVGIDSTALALAHEMVHLKYPVKAKDHRAAIWNEEYKRLVGLGFFREIF